MKMFSLFVLSVLVFEVGFSQTETRLRVDPENAMGGSVSEIFNGIDYIPLETNKQSLFGRIDKLIITNKYFLVLDHSTDAIFIFKKNGEFLLKITLDKWIKTPNKEFLGIKDFTVNEERSNIIVCHSQDFNHVYVMDFTGKLVAKPQRSFWLAIANIDRDHYFMESSIDRRDSAGKLGVGSCVVTNSFLSAYSSYMLPKINSSYNVGVTSRLTSGFGSNSVFYTRPYDYNAYQIDSTGIIQKYNFTFPLNYSLPPDFLDSSFIGKQRDYLNKNSKVVYSLSEVYKVKNFLFFKINKTDPYEIYKALMYNLSVGDLVSLRDVLPDSSNGYLPFAASTTKILAADSDHIYTSVSALDIFNASESAKMKNPVYPNNMRIFLSNQNKRSNPVIVKLKIK